MSTETRWPRPPAEGYHFEDLFTLPDLPPHTELLDAGLVFAAPRTDHHQLLVTLLETRIREVAPASLRVRREMMVRFSDRTGLEPDVVVVRAEAVNGRHQGSFDVADVLLAVEVVSPSSAERDRDTKPHKYAGAGIPYFWRVEWEVGPPTVVTHALGETGQYRPTGEFAERLIVADPFAVDIDLLEADKL